MVCRASPLGKKTALHMLYVHGEHLFIIYLALFLRIRFHYEVQAGPDSVYMQDVLKFMVFLSKSY